MEHSDQCITTDELAALRWNWGRAYEIDHEPGGAWRARRRDGAGEEITATDPDTLRNAMYRDYELNPVPHAEGT